MGFLDLKYETFGLDINDLSAKIIKLERRRKGFVLSALNKVKIAPGVIEGGVIKKKDVLAKIIKSAYEGVEGKKIKTKYVVASLPEEKSFSQVIQMPKMTQEELRLSVPLEAENYIPMPVSDAYLDFQVINPVKDYLNHLEVSLVAAPKKIVDAYVSCFEEAGFTPLILEPESEAVARALAKKGGNSSLMVFVDFGENNTNFIVFSGDSVRFTCTIPISSNLLTKTIAQSLGVSFQEAEKLKIEHGLSGKHSEKSPRPKGIPPEEVSRAITPIIEDLVGQIKKYLNFYRDHSSYEYLLPDRKIEKIFLCGGGAQLKGLTEFVAENLHAAVEIGNPVTNLLPLKSKTIAKTNLMSFTTAIGLALREEK